MTAIPLRVVLQSLAYILDGRARWLVRKATGNRKVGDNHTRAPGRPALADRLGQQAKAVERMVHDLHGQPAGLDAALVGRCLALAAGHLDGSRDLGQALAQVKEPGVRAVLGQLVNMNILPGG
jgi:hypothetical protein